MILKRFKFYSETESEDIDSAPSNNDFAKKAAIAGAGALGLGALSNFVDINEDAIDEITGKAKDDIDKAVRDKSSKVNKAIESVHKKVSTFKYIKDAFLDQVDKLREPIQKGMKIRR